MRIFTKWKKWLTLGKWEVQITFSFQEVREVYGDFPVVVALFRRMTMRHRVLHLALAGASLLLLVLGSEAYGGRRGGCGGGGGGCGGGRHVGHRGHGHCGGGGCFTGGSGGGGCYTGGFGGGCGYSTGGFVGHGAPVGFAPCGAGPMMGYGGFGPGDGVPHHGGEDKGDGKDGKKKKTSEEGDEEEGSETPEPAPATLIVTLPEDARLLIDDYVTSSTSGSRVFVTPPLAPGREFHYNLVAEVVRDGVSQRITRRVAVRAGQETQVNLEVATTEVVSR